MYGHDSNLSIVRLRHRIREQRDRHWGMALVITKTQCKNSLTPVTCEAVVATHH